MKMAAIYARVSSDQQREAHTIASQTASLIEFAQGHDLEVPKEWVFEDDGYSGATLERPGLERVRDLAARRPGLHIVKTFQLLLEDVHGELDTLKVSVTLTLGCLLPEQECLGDAHCGREVDVGRRVGRIPDDEQVFIDRGVWLRLPR